MTWRWCSRCHRTARSWPTSTPQCGACSFGPNPAPLNVCIGIMVPFRDQAMADTVFRLGGHAALRWHALNVDRFLGA